jgi:hypothetical protein
MMQFISCSSYGAEGGRGSLGRQPLRRTRNVKGDYNKWYYGKYGVKVKVDGTGWVVFC